MSFYHSAVPAYGRDYKNAKEVQQAWDDNKDFELVSFAAHGYINRAAAESLLTGDTINVRYNKRRKVYPIKVG